MNANDRITSDWLGNKVREFVVVGVDMITRQKGKAKFGIDLLRIKATVER